MGSFNATCIISGLQIQAGDSVRFFLLTESKYHQGNDHSCYVWGRWQLRGAAVCAKYNDYGSVEDIEDSLASRAMFEALNRDAVEKGVGDNQCHDVRVRRGMSQKEWLEALWEGRVFVRDATLRLKEGAHVEPREGLPSLSRVEKILEGAGLKTTTIAFDAGYFIDEVANGFVRVRHGSDDVAALEKALPLLQASYAAMIMCGTGNYAKHAEILVAPKPGNFSMGFHEDVPLDKPRAVSQVMVREDVWQALLCMETQSWGGSYSLKKMKADALLWLEEAQKKLRINFSMRALKARLAQSQDPIDRLGAVLLDKLGRLNTLTLGDAIQAAKTQGLDKEDALVAVERLARPQTANLHRYYVDYSGDKPRFVGVDEVRQQLLDGAYQEWASSIKVVWAENEQAVIDDPRGLVDASLFLLNEPDQDNLFSGAIHRYEGVSGFSLREAFRLGLQIADNAEELQQYVLDLAEMAYVQGVYGGTLHGQWHPTTNSGQDPEWEAHRSFLVELLKICDAQRDYEDEDDSEEDDFEDEDEDDDEDDSI
jgi:hypothetical protein